ncbi:hypothetical protein P879_04405 [Paragonimus westermani]|uniref:Uncharacterized protein n=1 Tax=Paragonimus westermani TaxID=34504 RepID=A0A8T0DPV8_9TREM|nr:hypothetical protein P879_04405 [Paragonimus westermani]
MHVIFACSCPEVPPFSSPFLSTDTTQEKSTEKPSREIPCHEDSRSSTDESCETAFSSKATAKPYFPGAHFGSQFTPLRLDLIHISACPTSCAKILITSNGKACIFSCEAFVVVVDMDTKSQHHLVGHTDTVMGLCMDPDGTMLASCQSSSLVGVVHVWRMPLLEEQGCRKTEHPIGTGRTSRTRTLRGVCLSKMSEFLFAFGEDPNGNGLILLWDVRVRYGFKRDLTYGTAFHDKIYQLEYCATADRTLQNRPVSPRLMHSAIYDWLSESDEVRYITLLHVLAIRPTFVAIKDESQLCWVVEHDQKRATHLHTGAYSNTVGSVDWLLYQTDCTNTSNCLEGRRGRG